MKNVEDPRRFIELYKRSTSRNSMRHPRPTTPGRCRPCLPHRCCLCLALRSCVGCPGVCACHLLPKHTPAPLLRRQFWPLTVCGVLLPVLCSTPRCVRVRVAALPLRPNPRATDGGLGAPVDRGWDVGDRQALRAGGRRAEPAVRCSPHSWTGRSLLWLWVVCLSLPFRSRFAAVSITPRFGPHPRAHRRSAGRTGFTSRCGGWRR